MNTRKRLLSLTIATLLGSGAMVSGMQAWADTAKAAEPATEKAAEPATEAAANEDTTDDTTIKTVEEAYSALREIRGARMAIFNGTPDEAVKLVADAQTDLEAVKANLAEHAVDVNRKLDENDAYIPFDTTMALAEGFVPTEEKAGVLDKANEHLSKGEKADAVETLKLANIEVSVSVAMIPANGSLEHVLDAARLLDEEKYYEANLALKAVEDSVIIESYDTNAMPAQGDEASQG